MLLSATHTMRGILQDSLHRAGSSLHFLWLHRKPPANAGSTMLIISDWRTMQILSLSEPFRSFAAG